MMSANKMQAVTILALLLVIPAAGAQGSSAGAKSYELYSWKVKTLWHYSIVEGPNRVKTFEDITSSPILPVGTAELEAALKRLKAGDRITWVSGAPPGVRRPANLASVELKHPSRNRIKYFIAYCKKLGIRMLIR
jgi:hypothetical protein